MSTATALQLCNRVQRLLRGEDLTSVTDAEGAVLLDLLNDATNTVLGERVWDFQIRHDGVLSWVGAVTRTAQTISSAFAQYIPVPDYEILHPMIARIAVTSDAAYGSTSFRGVNYDTATDLYTLDQTFPGTTSAAATVTLFAYEQVLPATVRAVLAARHEEQELKLWHVDKESDFDVAFPTPWLHTSDAPELLAIGGTGHGTYVTSGSASYGTILRIYPTPSASLRIDYSYIYMPARLTSATDTLPGVPEHVEEILVNLAYARAQQTGVGNEPTAGFAYEQRVLAEMMRRWGSHKPDHGRRSSIQPFDARHGPNPLYRGLPRIVGIL